MRLKPWKQMRGLSAIDGNSGKKVGTIEQIWLRAGSQQILGISVRGSGLRAKKLFVAMGDVRLLGDVSVIISAACAQPEGETALKLGNDIRVFGDDGEKVGWLTDLLIDEETGNVAALEVSKGYIDDLREGREWVREFTIRPCGVIAVMRAPV